MCLFLSCRVMFLSLCWNTLLCNTFNRAGSHRFQRKLCRAWWTQTFFPPQTTFLCSWKIFRADFMSHIKVFHALLSAFDYCIKKGQHWLNSQHKLAETCVFLLRMTWKCVWYPPAVWRLNNQSLCSSYTMQFYMKYIKLNLNM